jgi:hypothetical protein
MKLEDELVDIEPLDAIRVAPQVARSFEAGDEGLQLLAFSPRHEGDGELLMDFWKE